MLNEELFETPKDLEIAKLKYTIESFKKYDVERKQYISTLEIEVGKLKSYIEELEGDESVKSLRAKIKNQKEVIKNLQTKLHFASLEVPRITELELVTRDQLKRQIDSLREDYKNKKHECEQAWSIIAKYRNKFGEL